MTPGLRAVLFALACGIVLALAWWTGHPAALHPPEGPDAGTNRVNRRSWHHLLGAALTTLVGALVFGLAPVASAAIAVLAWAGVEAIQFWPKKPYVLTRIVINEKVAYTSRTGTWEWLDIVFDVLGAGVSWALLTLVGR